MRRYLTVEEIADLDRLFLRAFRAVEALRLESRVGVALHAVKVPPRLTESIVATYRDLIFDEQAVLVQACAPHDLSVRIGRRRLNLAVKGSGMADWAAITAADRVADALMWVDYRARILDDAQPVMVRRIPIARVPSEANRVFLGRLVGRAAPIRLWPS